MDFSLWLEFEEFEGGYPGPVDDPSCDFCNIEITVDSRKYAADVWTFGFLEFCRNHDEATGKPVTKPVSYLLPPDLLVEQMDRETIEFAIQELLKEGGLPKDWLVLE